jgi:hypothetical protein
MPVAQYAWVCKEIDPADFAKSYAINFWYSNRTASGGLFIGQDNSSTVGGFSLYENSTQNSPDLSNKNIYWVPLMNHYNWMVRAVITADEYICPELTTNVLDIANGRHILKQGKH